MARACPRSDLRSRLSWTLTGSVGLESPQTTGVTETLRGLSRQVGVSQKQARPLDADALAADQGDCVHTANNAWGLA